MSHSSLEYRITDYAASRRRMLDRLPLTEIPDGDNQGSRPLAALTTRDADDPAIALLDAAAVVCEVLTFYQERYANENYLRTASERRSILELARAAGYELSPGVAAGAFLAFSVEDAPGAADAAQVPSGTRVQSIPGQDQLPQTFETADAITARGEWNQMRPRQRRPQDLEEPTELFLDGVATGLAPGDLLLLVVSRSGGAPPDAAVVRVRRIVPNADAGYTTVELQEPAWYLNRSGRIRGIGTRFSDEIEVDAELAVGDERRTVTTVDGDGALTVEYPFRTTLPPGSVIARAGTGTVSSADVGVSGTSTAFLGEGFGSGRVIIAGGQERVITSVGSGVSLFVDRPFDPPLAGAEFSVRLTGVVSGLADPVAGDPVRVFALRRRAPVFGHNAPLYDGLPDPTAPEIGDTLQGNAFPHDWDAGDGWQIWDDPLANEKWQDADAFLEGTVGPVLPDGWVVLESTRDGLHVYNVLAATDGSISGFGLNGKATGLELAVPGGERLRSDDPMDKPPALKVRETVAHLVSEELTLVDRTIDAPVPPPRPDPIDGDVRTLMLERAVTGLRPGQTLAVSGKLAAEPDRTVAEIAVLRSADQHTDPRYTILRFQNDLAHRYLRDSLTINGNVVLATHGESVREPLGSGDAGQANQRMTLGQSPLTHLPAATARSIRTTLEVRVDDVLWQQVDSRADLGPDTTAYQVRIDDDGRATVIFGDGTSGARPASGQDNVVAEYRVGNGVDGNVAADTISLLTTRPLGIREVTNPIAAAGGAPPDDVETARANAPVTARTQGRIVSLRDFADFTRAFAGIDKVLVVPLRGVHVTVAGVAGAPVTPGSVLYRNLVRAIETARLPGPPVRVDTYQPLLFRLAANLVLDPRYLAEVVLPEVRDSLLRAFAFDRRDFGQNVYASEIIARCQQVPGVVAVDLDALHLDTAAARLNTVLTADTTRLLGGAVAPAQQLRIDPRGITLREVHR